MSHYRSRAVWIAPTVAIIASAASGRNDFIVECGPPDLPSTDCTVCQWDCQDTPNGFVDIGDMFKLFGHWFAAGPCDFDSSGLGDINDLFEMFGNWGICP